jgi:hypothetical protein
LTTLISLTQNTGLGSFFHSVRRRANPERKYSDWMELTEGEKYYLQVEYVEYGWTDHMKTGVEIEQTEIVNHH